MSQRNFNTYGKAGLVLAPSRTKVMCSFYSDFGTFDRGCATAGLRDSGAIVPFPPDKLRRMLKISYSDENVEHAMYNEILIDAKQYIRTLPGSLAAVVYFYDEVRLRVRLRVRFRVKVTVTLALALPLP